MTRGAEQVVVVGAGPTGLTAACELLRHGVRVRVLDKRDEPSGHSKALLLWPRTVEVLAQLGVEKEARGRAIPIGRFSYYSSGRPVARLDFDAETTPLCLPQRGTEDVLRELLGRLGGRVERGWTLQGLDQRADAVELRLTDPEGADRTLTADWVIGADGAHSTVRDALGVPFEGATYANAFMLADAHGGRHLARDEAHYFQSPGGVLVVVPLPDGRHRWFVNAPHGEETATLPLLQRLVDERGPGGVALEDPEWISTFRVHHRLAARMRQGRCFLTGDAAHIHSPAGGQGLNTGLQDAHNLAWKLAGVIQGRFGTPLLDTYERERHAVARQVVRDTDIQTRAWLVSVPWKIRARDALLRGADRTGMLRKYAPVMAGRRVTYPAVLPPSVLPSRTLSRRRRTRSGIGTVFPDHLLPASLRIPRPQGPDATPQPYHLVTVGREASGALHEKAARTAARWSPVLTHIRLTGEASALPRGDAGFYLVRPDGYIAFHGHSGDLVALDDVLAGLSVRRPPAPAPADAFGKGLGHAHTR
ncbi:FAD-dependent oxidoreductase [Streptomyces sp. TRM68367]|uniref:FAD-dependent oxidoreductase n=1 Tax=Streptomyces sp. TRM68367 TaxID=2758415 RepID=UPI00165B4BD0|nr:FAD-dependent oxidoreductase [Streptomyces sp. TRM68367]MBC9725832.1 FAD-dependent oxidoreductase [Streptomyces sp. TRM68367]